MTNIVIQSGYKRFEPVGQSDKCKDCPSYCKTSCARQDETDNHIKPEDFENFKPAFGTGNEDQEL